MGMTGSHDARHLRAGVPAVVPITLDRCWGDPDASPKEHYYLLLIIYFQILMSSELQEVMEFLRDHVPTKEEIADLQKHLDDRIDKLESKLDFGERLRRVEERLAKLEDERPSDDNDGDFVDTTVSVRLWPSSAGTP